MKDEGCVCLVGPSPLSFSSKPFQDQMVPMKGDDGKPMGWTMVFQPGGGGGGGGGGWLLKEFELSHRPPFLLLGKM